MKLLVITSAPLLDVTSSRKAYAPYVEEMVIWSNNVDQIQFCCPIWETDRGLLSKDITFKIDKVFELNEFSFRNLNDIIRSIRHVILNLIIIYQAMKASDHIHLRCPGNMGLLGCIVQIMFPKKPKTAKYAGNWDPKSKQPWTYRLQKKILRNTLLTKNMQVLVYGEWPNQTKNIKPFFTATYSENEIVQSFPYPQFISGALELDQNEKILKKVNDKDVIKFIYVGTLTKNKRPLLCLEVVQQLKQLGFQVQLELYGEGYERHEIENYILDYHLQEEVVLKGNVSKEELISAYQRSHFLLFFSQSEGWPKAVAEAMFWECVPLTTAVSCVPYMLGNGTRGSLVEADKLSIIAAIKNYVNNPGKYIEHAQQAMDWSRQYTLEKFDMEIKKLMLL